MRHFYNAIPLLLLFVSCLNLSEEYGTRTVTVFSTQGGEITPTMKVFKGGQTFFFNPDKDYVVYDIRVNGVSYGAVRSVWFDPLHVDETSKDTIVALFMPAPVAHWSFDSSKQNTFYDVSGNGHNAVDSNKANLQLVNGVKGKAIHMSGDQFRIKIPGTKDKFDSPTFSVALWFRSDSSFLASANWKNLKKIFHYCSGHNGLMLGVNWDGLFAFAVDGPESQDEWLYSKSILEKEIWYYCVVTYNYQDVNIYINGKKENGKTMRKYTSSEVDLGIGNTAYGEDMGRFNGYMDEIRLFDTVLDSAFIAAEYEYLIPED